MTASIAEPAPARVKMKSPSASQNLARFRAPFALRCGAILIDYIILVAILAFSTLVSRVLGGGALGGQLVRNCWHSAGDRCGRIEPRSSSRADRIHAGQMGRGPAHSERRRQRDRHWTRFSPAPVRLSAFFHDFRSGISGCCIHCARTGPA